MHSKVLRTDELELSQILSVDFFNSFGDTSGAWWDERYKISRSFRRSCVRNGVSLGAKFEFGYQKNLCHGYGEAVGDCRH